MKKIMIVVCLMVGLSSYEGFSQEFVEKNNEAREKSFTLKPASQQLEVEAFPNPFVNKLKITGINSFSGKIVVENYSGELIKMQEIIARESHTFDAREWPAGIYFIKFFNDHGEMLTIKKMVKRF